MSEAIGEMILPGTYIEVRSEGLIGVGGIATGNVGVVGTANRGPLNKVVILGSYAEALDTFGGYDAWSTAAGATPLSLTRALEQIFTGGASTVYAVRVSDASAGMKTVTIPLLDGTKEVVVLTATSPGTWANTIDVSVDKDSDPKSVTLKLGASKEQFSYTTADELIAAVNSGSRLVSAAPGKDAGVPTAKGTIATVASNGIATKVELKSGLDLLATEDVNIVVAAGFDQSAAGGTMLAHIEATENAGKERIAVVGASTDDVATIGGEVPSSARIVYVAPGILATDAATGKQVNLPASYAAALVAGRMATLATHISLTNKDIAADGLTTYYTRAQQKQLLNKHVLVLQKNFGIRVLKGITTDSGAFKQISVRRIVDEAKAGVRLGSNPYIGRLNNARVRAALKATLDGFLSGLVVDEKLVGYTLDVSATRAEEINGIALVTMTLLPTFSIDFVKVIMTLS